MTKSSYIAQLEAELDEVKEDRDRLLQILREIYVQLDLRREELNQMAQKTEFRDPMGLQNE
jgi:hypothetical protein